MGQCFILSRDARSRYTIAVDLGEANRSALLLIANNRLGDINAQLVRLASQVAAADAREAALQQRANDAFAAYAALASPAPTPSTAELDAALRALAAERAANVPLRQEQSQARLAKITVTRRIAYLAGLTLTITKQVWRPIWEHSSSKLAVGVVGWTIDVDNMPDLQLLGGVGLPASDGLMTAPGVMSPEQAYWNVAVGPGWQKYRPTYRWGVVAGVNYDSHSVDVLLDPAFSITQSLDINQSASLTGVPSEYLGTGLNIYAFAPGDRVVVRFVGQDWSQPRLVGFLDNPIKGRHEYAFAYSVFNWAVFPEQQPAAVPISSGYVSRLTPVVAGMAPNIWEIGYYKIGWGDKGDIDLVRTVSWSNDTDDLIVGGSYGWLNMRNNGYGDTAVGFPTPPQFYPDDSLGIGGAVEGGYGGDSRQWVWYVRIVPVSFLSPTLGITQEWTAQPWGSISGENSFLPFYCDGPYDYTCGDAPHGTLTVDVVWRLSNNGDVIGTSQIVIGKRSGGGAFLVLEQAHDNIWGM